MKRNMEYNICKILKNIFYFRQIFQWHCTTRDIFRDGKLYYFIFAINNYRCPFCICESMLGIMRYQMYIVTVVFLDVYIYSINMFYLTEH